MVSMICKRGYEVRVLSDKDGGFYKGAVDQRFPDTPVCRLTCVVPDPKLAAKLPISRQFDCGENVYCNDRAGCFK